jgi:hypothetical protein
MDTCSTHQQTSFAALFTPMLSLRRGLGLALLVLLAALAILALPGPAHAAGWTLREGAAAVAGNEPFFVGDPGDARSL